MNCSFLIFYDLAHLMNSKARGLSIGLLHILHKNHPLGVVLHCLKLIRPNVSNVAISADSACYPSVGRSVAARLNPGLELTHLVPY